MTFYSGKLVSGVDGFAKHSPVKRPAHTPLNSRPRARKFLLGLLAGAALLLAGCSTNVGVGMSVGVPIGDHGYMSIGGSTGRGRWY